MQELDTLTEKLKGLAVKLRSRGLGANSGSIISAIKLLEDQQAVIEQLKEKVVLLETPAIRLDPHNKEDIEYTTDEVDDNYTIGGSSD
tara:strand:+ start:15394 stop:15657 length:264 start_codon:yes stop_codon:yes gene_type:complete